ncbi:MAG: hypothetical protein GY754_11380 [bacterium]|nr:hypothetical protein [bacterium]
MITRLYLFLTQFRIVIPALILTSALILVTTKLEARITGSQGMGLVYLQLSFNSLNFQGVIVSWGKSGVDFFLKVIWVYFAYPLAYAFLLSAAPGYFFRKMKSFDPAAIPKADLWFIVVPFGAALFDFIVCSLFYVILSQRDFSKTLVTAASIAALIKWILLAVSMAWFLRKYFQFRKEA